MGKSEYKNINTTLVLIRLDNLLVDNLGKTI